MNAFTPIEIGERYYAGVVAAKRAINTARTCGIDVGGIELRPDGTVAVFDSRTAIAIASRDIDRK